MVRTLLGLAGRLLRCILTLTFSTSFFFATLVGGCLRLLLLTLALLGALPFFTPGDLLLGTSLSVTSGRVFGFRFLPSFAFLFPGFFV